MSALCLLFGFREEVSSHVIVDIRLLVLLLLKGFTATAVLLFLRLLGETEPVIRLKRTTNGAWQLGGKKSQGQEHVEGDREETRESSVVLLQNSRVPVTSPSLLIDHSNLVVTVNGAHLRERFMLTVRFMLDTR